MRKLSLYSSAIMLIVPVTAAVLAPPVSAETFGTSTGHMMQTGWTDNGDGSVTGTNVHNMKMAMKMSQTPKETALYDFTFTISGFSCNGGGTACSVQPFVGIDMPAATVGTWKLAAGATRRADRFTWAIGHGIEAGGPDFSVPPYNTTGPGNSVEDIGSWRDFCGPSVVGAFDHLLYPGKPGASHPHVFIGNDMPDRDKTTYTSLRTKGSSSCQDNRGVQAKYPINASAYWMPAFIVKVGNKLYVKKPNGALLYYKGFPIPSPTIDYTGITPYGAIATANGTSTITRTSGALFTTFGVGQTLYVGASSYTVASIADGSHMTLSGTVTTGTGIQVDVMSQSLKTDAGRSCNEAWGRGDGGTGTGLRSDGGPASLTVDQFGNTVTDLTRCPWMPPQMEFITGYNKANGQGKPTVAIDATTGDNGTGAGGVVSGTLGAQDYSIWKGPSYGTDHAQEQVTPNFKTLTEAWDWMDLNPGIVQSNMVLHVSTGGPTCWDGKYRSSPDYRSHVAWGILPTAHLGNVRCPVDKPYPLVHMSEQWYFSLDASFMSRGWALSVDRMDDTLQPGEGLHSDYVEAQSPIMAQKARDNCEGPHNACTQELGDGTKLTTPVNFDGSSPFCNACMKHRPDRNVPITEFGQGDEYRANGTYTIRIRSAGAKQWGVLGNKGVNATVSNMSITRVALPSAKGPATVTVN